MVSPAWFGALRCAVLAPFGCSAVLTPGRPFASAMELSSAFAALDLYVRAPRLSSNHYITSMFFVLELQMRGVDLRPWEALWE